MSSDLFTRLFEPIFPPTGNTVVFRAGFMRIQGPYGHAIALGWMMALGFRIVRWLEWNGAWSDRMRFLPMSKIRFCELWIAAGSIMSLSVGPLVGSSVRRYRRFSLPSAQPRARDSVVGIFDRLVGPPILRT